MGNHKCKVAQKKRISQPIWNVPMFCNIPNRTSPKCPDQDIFDLQTCCTNLNFLTSSLLLILTLYQPNSSSIVASRRRKNRRSSSDVKDEQALSSVFGDDSRGLDLYTTHYLQAPIVSQGSYNVGAPPGWVRGILNAVLNFGPPEARRWPAFWAVLDFASYCVYKVGVRKTSVNSFP